MREEVENSDDKKERKRNADSDEENKKKKSKETAELEGVIRKKGKRIKESEF